MRHYKSWSSLNKQLDERLCDELKGRIQYFLTRYHDVHNSYGRAAVRLDGEEIVGFTWMEMYHQEWDTNELYRKNKDMDYEKRAAEMKPVWDAGCTYSDMDFIDAAVRFLDMPIGEALESDNFIIKILAVMDRRIGKRRLMRIAGSMDYEGYPDWAGQFYRLRLFGNLK